MPIPRALFKFKLSWTKNNVQRNLLYKQPLIDRLAAELKLDAACPACHQGEIEMLSIHGKAIQRTLREFNRAALGCPSILHTTMGSRSQVAKDYRDFRTEPTR